ncbi:MAG: bifunctional adenosylcobinamide kinase/adenosylcobinamide-phosphate guanylyltransferase, partial [Lachnospiraceae bacterium]|nr:bifunctional adenosylcobinamide kinase/adenosylcobinamide-phosphate guanylyltransferase [Lachnospiraceae bacterium]
GLVRRYGMVFVIGGSASGAKEYAVRYYVEQLQAQGDLILNYQDEIRQEMDDITTDTDPMESAQTLAKNNTAGVIHMQEMGCGIVPIEKKDREYRELVGRISCLFAEHADEVYRVICGIAQKIK